MTTPKHFKTLSVEIKDEGSIPMTQTQTPVTHSRLMSREDLRLRIFKINGMLQNGMSIAKNIPKV